MTQVAYTSTSVVAEPDAVVATRAVLSTPIRWDAILAGSVTAIACQFFFTVLGIAIGVSTTDAADSADASSITMAAGGWWLISGTISLLIGGMVLGMLATLPKGYALSLNAVAFWAVTAIFGFAVLWSGAGMAGNAAMFGAAAGASANDARWSSPSTGDSGAPTTTEADVRASQERAADVAQSAAWWSVIALVVGVSAAVIGANLPAKLMTDRGYRMTM